MPLPRVPKLLPQRLLHDLELVLGRVAQQNALFLRRRHHSPDSPAPVVPIDMVFEVPGVVSADNSVEPAREEEVLCGGKGEVADACSVGALVFVDEGVVGVEVDGVDLISGDEDILVEGVESAGPDSILVLGEGVSFDHSCMTSGVLRERSKMMLKTVCSLLDTNKW